MMIARKTPTVLTETGVARTTAPSSLRRVAWRTASRRNSSLMEASLPSAPPDAGQLLQAILHHLHRMVSSVFGACRVIFRSLALLLRFADLETYGKCLYPWIFGTVSGFGRPPFG